MSVVEMCEKIFLLSEVKMKFSTEQKLFIVYYAIKSYKKVWEKFSAKYTEILFILTMIVRGQVKIHMNIASQVGIPKK